MQLQSTGKFVIRAALYFKDIASCTVDASSGIVSVFAKLEENSPVLRQRAREGGRRCEKKAVKH